MLMLATLKIPASWDVTLCGQLKVTGGITVYHLIVSVVAAEYVNFNLRFLRLPARSQTLNLLRHSDNYVYAPNAVVTRY